MLSGLPSSPIRLPALQWGVLRNWLKALSAVLLGNLFYVLLMPHLPPIGRHRPRHLDWGLLVDFWLCLAVFGLIDLCFRKCKLARRS